MANRDHCCLLGTPLQNEYNEHVKNDEHDNVEIEYNERVKNDDNNVQIEYNVHVKNDEHVNVEIEYNEHVKNYVHDNVEINDKQSMIQNPRSIDSIVQRPRSFEQRTSFSLFPIMHDSYDNQWSIDKTVNIDRNFHRLIVSEIVSIKDRSILESVDWYLLFYILSPEIVARRP